MNLCVLFNIFTLGLFFSQAFYDVQKAIHIQATNDAEEF